MYAHNLHTTPRVSYDIILYVCAHVKRHALGVPSFCTIECRDNALWAVADGRGHRIVTQIWKNILYRQNVLNIYTRSKYYTAETILRRILHPSGEDGLFIFDFLCMCTCKSLIIWTYPSTNILFLPRVTNYYILIDFIDPRMSSSSTVVPKNIFQQTWFELGFNQYDSETKLYKVHFDTINIGW